MKANPSHGFLEADAHVGRVGPNLLKFGPRGFDGFWVVLDLRLAISDRVRRASANVKDVGPLLAAGIAIVALEKGVHLPRVILVGNATLRLALLPAATGDLAET